jgi:hypothetical protein
MDLLNKKVTVTKSEYEAESISVTKNSWIQYCAEEFDPQSYDTRNPINLTYHPERSRIPRPIPVAYRIDSLRAFEGRRRHG